MWGVGVRGRPDRFVWSPRVFAARRAARDFRLAPCHHAPMSEPILERLRTAFADRYELHEELGARN